MQQQCAESICSRNMQNQYAAAICRINMQQQYAESICSSNMQNQYAAAICSSQQQNFRRFGQIGLFCLTLGHHHTLAFTCSSFEKSKWGMKKKIYLWKVLTGSNLGEWKGTGWNELHTTVLTEKPKRWFHIPTSHQNFANASVSLIWNFFLYHHHHHHYHLIQILWHKILCSVCKVYSEIQSNSWTWIS